MRLNLFQHSLPSETLVVQHESSGTLDELKAKLRAEHQPFNQTEEILVNEMAEQFWRLRRARAMETNLLDSDQVLIPHMAAIQRMMSSAERGFHKALTVLRRLQKDRGFIPQPAEPRLEGAVKLTAESSELTTHSGSRSESASALGFVPPLSLQTKKLIPQTGRAPSRPGAVSTRNCSPDIVEQAFSPAASRGTAPHTPVARKQGLQSRTVL